MPTLAGWLRPTILLPVSALTGLEPALIEALLAHELAHVRRHDVLVNHLQTAAETLLFFHPAARWVSARIREERERACDDLAAAACGDPVLLARALSALEEQRHAAREEASPALAASGGSLVDRVRRLIGRGPSGRRPLRRGLVAAIAPAPLAGALALLYACATGTPAPVGAEAAPSAVSTAPDSNVGGIADPGAGRRAPATAEPYRYDPVGKRDPYRAYDASIIEPPLLWRGTPAQQWDLEQLQMVGILRDDGAPRVMLEDPDGQGHVLEVGDYVGRRRGQITGIQDRQMVVTEWIRDPDWGRVPIDRRIELPEPG